MCGASLSTVSQVKVACSFHGGVSLTSDPFDLSTFAAFVKLDGHVDACSHVCQYLGGMFA